MGSSMRRHKSFVQPIVCAAAVAVSVAVTTLAAPVSPPHSTPAAGDTKFDDLAVLTLCRCSRQPARLLNLQYGAKGPAEQPR